LSFTTLTFAVFLPLVFLAHWRARECRGQNAVLLAASYVFYGWWDWRFCLLIFASSAVDFLLAPAIERSNDPLRRKRLLGVSLVFNLGVLATFKYFDFFVGSLVQAAAVAGLEVQAPALRLILPVGISFYTFQTLSYKIDVYRRELAATRKPIEYFTYVAFFPQLVAGPIERGKRLLPQLQKRRTFDPEQATDGVRQILWGLFKKVAIADNLARAVDMCFGQQCSGAESLVSTFFFAFQIYWDFSAYSDIAIGSARLFGVRLCRNFALPYFSQSVAEFWRRWHISLSTWFRDYVYIPLGGRRVLSGRRFLNVLATFTISGLWHGAGWHFVAWGALNGLLAAPLLMRAGSSTLGPEDTPGGEPALPSPLTLLRMLGTFLLICSTWVFFRAENMGQALGVYRDIGGGIFSREGWQLRTLGPEFVAGFAALVGLVVLVEWVQRRQAHALVFDGLPRWARWGVYTCLFWLTLLLQRNEISAFIYFQF
jgi:D-alanyl-lipoteichoic acid acyltransferase DltB (MBOAT superfamily)